MFVFLAIFLEFMDNLFFRFLFLGPLIIKMLRVQQDVDTLKLVFIQGNVLGGTSLVFQLDA